MSAPSKKEMLENVEKAINARLNGGAVQSYSIDGRNVQYIDVTELMQLRTQLKKEIACAQDMTTYAEFQDPV